MEILVAVLGVIVVLLIINNIRIAKRLKESKTKYEENDKLLTKYVSDNLDMEKELKRVKSDYEKQKILYTFNDTSHEYDCDSNSTLFSLFEKTAKDNLILFVKWLFV